MRGGEPVGTLRVTAGALRGTRHHRRRGADAWSTRSAARVRREPAPEGTRAITGAGELRVKESDRIATVVANLRAVGADAEELPDGMVVAGSDAPVARTRRHARRPSDRDGVRRARRAADGGAIEIDDRACVDVSFPGFWERLARAVEP